MCVVRVHTLVWLVVLRRGDESGNLPCSGACQKEAGSRVGESESWGVLRCVVWWCVSSSLGSCIRMIACMSRRLGRAGGRLSGRDLVLGPGGSGFEFGSATRRENPVLPGSIHGPKAMSGRSHCVCTGGAASGW